MVLEGEAEEVAERVAILMGRVDMKGRVDVLGGDEFGDGVGQGVV